MLTDIPKLVRTRDFTVNKIIFFNLEPEALSEPEKPKTIRKLALTTYPTDGCGGLKVSIELEVDNKICNTKEIPNFIGGDTLLWFGTYLGSCRDFVFEENWEQINFRVKENNTGDNFCPTYLYVFVDGDGENDVTFKSNDMYCSTCISSYDYSTNDKNHNARKTAGSFYFELPQSGKSVNTFIFTYLF